MPFTEKEFIDLRQNVIKKDFGRMNSMQLDAVVTANSKNNMDNKGNIDNKNSIGNKHSDKSENSKSDNLFSGLNVLKMLNFKNMEIDSDRMIIIAICLLLSKEDVDEMLLLALIYIMI